MSWPTFLYPDPKRGPQTWTMVKHARDRSRPDVDARPWYLRPPAGHPSKKSWHSLESSDVRQAERNARTFLDAWNGDSSRHKWAQARLSGPALVTVAKLAEEWCSSGCPDADERPRTNDAADRLKDILGRALPWWGPQNPALVTRETLKDYARIRRIEAQRRRGQTGDRAIDLELACLSSLGQWAVATGRIAANPWAERPRFRRPEDVDHCNEFRPATDEELHAILRWLWNQDSLERRVAGAVLAWCALTGQRPGEVDALRVDGQVIGDRRPPGTRWRMKDGTERIAVHRSKGGINPAVRVHPALDAFLGSWLAYRASQWPKSPWYFPNPHAPADALSSLDPLHNALGAATAALRLEHRKPHAMRAFYVRCRRSDGIDDATIAVELGQGSGPGLIVTTYGRADDILGDGAFDWLPEAPTTPAWDLLRASAPANLVALDTRLDTSEAVSNVSQSASQSPAIDLNKRLQWTGTEGDLT